MAPLAALPPGLRDEVLELCTDSSPETLSYRRDVTQRAGAFLPNGFPQAIRAPRRRMIALSGAAAVVGVLVAIMATGIVTVLALTGSHSPRSAEAGGGSSSGSASAPAAGDTGVPSGISPGCRSQPVAGQHRVAGQQRAAPGGTRVRLAEPGKTLVAFGCAFPARLPDAAAHDPSQADGHVDRDLDGHLDRHQHGAADVHVPGHAADVAPWPPAGPRLACGARGRPRGAAVMSFWYLVCRSDRGPGQIELR